MRTLIAALFLVFALALPAKAADECKVTWESQHALMSAENGWRGVELTAEDRANFVANFNAEPPASDFHPDSVWVLKDTNYDQNVVNVVFVKDGCVQVNAIDMPLNVLLDFLTPLGKPI